MSQSNTAKKSDFYSELVLRCDKLLMEGKTEIVASEIAQLNFAQLPREYRKPLAHLCRRAGQVTNGLRILYPIIRSEETLRRKPTDEEICEYSALISRNGSIDEGLELLTQVNTAQVPQALLYQAFGNISKWEYSAAADFLKKYIAQVDQEYQQLIAKVNLASCFIAIENYEFAVEYLQYTIQLAKKLKATRLIGNCLELRAQAYLFLGKYNLAKDDLNEALKIFEENKVFDQLFTIKWKSILEGVESQSIEPILRFRIEATTRKSYESVRESDLFCLKIQFDQKLFDHLVVGSNFPSYRKRVLNLLKREPNKNYFFGGSSQRFLDLTTGKVSGGRFLNPGKKIHQTLAALCNDFYSPSNLGILHSTLYPGEYYNIHTSPAKIHQVIKRTRQWILRQKIPLLVHAEGGAFSLSVLQGFAINVPLEKPTFNANEVLLNTLKKSYAATEAFTIDAACNSLGISHSNFHRFARWAVAEGKIVRRGIGKQTEYAIA